MKLTKAVILAAGRGTRMQELTETVAKPMLEIQGRPLLAHLVEDEQLTGRDLDEIRKMIHTSRKPGGKAK